MSQELKNPLFARFFHRFCGRDRGRGEQELRRELLAGASGRAVEVGAGNGINFEHYPTSVAELIAVEPEPYLRSQAEKAATEAPVPVRVVPGVAASLGLDDGSADVIVVSGVLCSVPDHWSRFMGGCHTDRDTLAAIEGAGFRIEHSRGFGFPPQARAYPVAPRILGIARPA